MMLHYSEKKRSGFELSMDEKFKDLYKRGEHYGN